MKGVYRLHVLLSALLLALGPVPSVASQNNLQMPTVGVVSGLQFSNKVTDALDSLVTCNSGSVAPTNAAGAAPKLGQCWIDTTNSSLPIKKRYTGSGWTVEGVLDVSNGIWIPPSGGGAGSVASATTTDLCVAPAELQTVSGTTTIASFGSNCVTGVRKTLVFAAALTLTYNATSMILPAQRDYTTAAGDVGEAVYLGGGNWRVVSIVKIDGTSVANPAVPVSSKLDYFGFAPPTNYVFGFGQAISRASFPDYLAAVTSVQSVTRTNGSRVLTGFSDTTQFGAGMPVEGTGIPAGATISTVDSGTQITLDVSHSASSSGTANVTVFAHGYGSGGNSTTVGLPDCRGAVIASRDNLGGSSASNLTTSNFGTSPNALGGLGGAGQYVLLGTNLPTLSLTASVFIRQNTTFATTGASTALDQLQATGGGGIQSQTYAVNNWPGLGTAFSLVQPTRLANCIVRVLP